MAERVTVHSVRRITILGKSDQRLFMIGSISGNSSPVIFTKEQFTKLIHTAATKGEARHGFLADIIDAELVITPQEENK
jgi:hypothetical protein